VGSNSIFVEMMRKVSFFIKEKMQSSWVDYGNISATI